MAQVIQAKNGRWYELDSGLVVPSVTTILDVYPKPELLRWYGTMPSVEEAERIRDEAAAWGTTVHEAISQLVAGEEVDISQWESLRARKQLIGFYNWWSAANPALLSNEAFVVYSTEWAGVADLVVQLPGGEVWLIDVKTSSAVYASHLVQVAAYRAAWNQERRHPFVDRSGVLLLKDSTKKGWQLVETVEYDNDLAAMEACRVLYHHMNGWEPVLPEVTELPAIIHLEVHNG